MCIPEGRNLGGERYALEFCLPEQQVITFIRARKFCKGGHNYLIDFVTEHAYINVPEYFMDTWM